MTNWVTVKIPESVRDEAKDVDGHTYHELMERGIKAVDGGTHTHTQSNGDVAVDEIVTALKDEISMANEPGVEVDTEQIINRLDEVEEKLNRRLEALERKQ